MPSERVQRQIDRLLDEAEAAMSRADWATVRSRAQAVLALDPANEDARAYLDAADRTDGAATAGEAQGKALRQAQDKALRQAQDKALRQAQDKALRQAQDKALRQAQDKAGAAT